MCITRYNYNYSMDPNIFKKLLTNNQITSECINNILDNDSKLVDIVIDYSDNTYDILLKLCKLNNKSKYIIKKIENGVIPDIDCLISLCKTKQNIRAIEKVLEYIEPTKEALIAAYKKK